MSDEGYIWDSDKLERVRAKHDVEMLEAIEAELDPHSMTLEDPQGNWDRYMIVGQTSSGRILQVICTDEDTPLVRFITAFEAGEHWRRSYEQRS